MRVFARCSLILVLVTLTAGPLVAAPVSLTTHPMIAAPTDPAARGGGLLTVLVSSGVLFGTIRVKDTGSLAKKFVQRAGAAQNDYKDGVTQAGGDWEQNTKASEDNYAAGTQAAIADKRFGKGVAAAGAGKYVQRAQTLGSQRYPGGIAAAEGAWAQGTQPYLQTIASMTLPPRRPKGDPANQQRANVVAAALRAQRLGK